MILIFQSNLSLSPLFHGFLEKAVELAKNVGGEPIPLGSLSNREELEKLAIKAGANFGKLEPVLLNSTSVGMQPNDGETPVPQVVPILILLFFFRGGGGGGSFF